MDLKNIEEKWNTYWEKNKVFKFDINKLENKKYIMEMFSYPSGSRLHIGHLFNFSIPDSFAKYCIMKGENVFQPMGFDAFGLPAENFAFKTGIHPRESTYNNMEYMEKQLKKAGLNFDWEYTLRTCNPNYYKWTQWLFLKLYERGLAVQKHAPVNWCPSCSTVLANEQVVDGCCERCGSQIIHKNLTQWFFKITDYAERLLEGLDKIDWPEKTKVSQKNWIGKSVGAEVDFLLEKPVEVLVNEKQNLNNIDFNQKKLIDKITVFTSRPDTIFGATYLVLAPENPITLQITSLTQKQEVENYINSAIKKDEIARQSTTLEKTGVFTGCYAINPANNKKIPIYTADYVLATYATGAVMGVPAHDERDFQFAQKYNLPIIQVIKPLKFYKQESCKDLEKKSNLSNNEKNLKLPYVEDGELINSCQFDGLNNQLAKEKIIQDLEKNGKARKKINYKLRDWSVSRQRYWGCPIPIIHCDSCGIVPVPEKDLPVLLPETMDYHPDGTSPLAKNQEYMNVICPKCGKPARRDPDTLDTFVCSSWYELRYPSANIDDKIFDTELTNKMCPVDYYVGGMEHANGHLLYSRFITKVLFDAGLINFDEPFSKLIHQGMILGPDGQKMSKSKGNVINPDELIEKFGSDAVRLYLIFGFNYVDGGPWNDDGIKNCYKFMERVERFVDKVVDLRLDLNNEKSVANNTRIENLYDVNEKNLDYIRNYTINEYEKNVKAFTFNSAIARIMEFVNALYKYETFENKNVEFLVANTKDLIQLLAPFTPHLAEELWHKFNQDNSVFKSGFPKCDINKLIKDEIEIVVQINSKIVKRINIPTKSTNQEIENIAKKEISNKLMNREILKTIVIPNRLINFIIKI